jgi:hypothetical protein
MSELRKQLQAAKDAYLTEKYRGNLANDVLPPAQSGISPWKLALIGLSAAAMLLVGITYWPVAPRENVVVVDPPSQDEATVAAVETAEEIETDADETEQETVSYAIAEVPALPEIGSLWASADDTSNNEITALVPSFPSMTVLAETETDSETPEGE